MITINVNTAGTAMQRLKDLNTVVETENNLLRKRIEEMEEQTSAGQHEYRRQVRNAALEEAAQLFDNLVKSSNWNRDVLEFFAVKIRALKEE